MEQKEGRPSQENRYINRVHGMIWKRIIYELV
jgi:hypothetical protein